MLYKYITYTNTIIYLLLETEHTTYRLYAKTLHICSPPLQSILPADFFESICIKIA